MVGDTKRARDVGRHMTGSRGWPVSFRAVAACFFFALSPGVALGDWSARTASYIVRQSAKDITVAASAGGSVAFSARAFAAVQYRLLMREFALPPMPSGVSSQMFVRHRFQFVSLTGPLLAIRDQADVDVKTSAIPAGKARFWTVDLRRGATYGFADDPLNPSTTKPGAFVDLRSLFPDQVIAAATAATDFGRQAGSKPGDGLPDVLYDLAQLGRKAPNCFLPEAGSTWSFAIAGRRAPTVSVLLGLPGQSYCRTNLTVLRLALPQSDLRQTLGPELLPPVDLPVVTVEIGTPRKQ